METILMLNHFIDLIAIHHFKPLLMVQPFETGFNPLLMDYNSLLIRKE